MKTIKYVCKAAMATIFLLMFFGFSYVGTAQIFCSYGSFNDSSWGNWRKETGNRWLVDNTTIRSIYYSFGNPDNDQFEITRLGGRYPVPFSNDTIRHTPWLGGKHAIHLGDNFATLNTSIPTPVNKISLKTRVTDECLSFWYALVLRYHPEQDDGDPFFMFRVWDSTGINIIDSLTFYRWADISDTPYYSLAVFNSTNIYVYRDWTEHRVNMSGLVGQEVTLEFIVADCSQQVHSGDAYLDNICFGSCCSSCDELFNYDPAFFIGSEYYRTITENYHTATEVCYQVNTGRFDTEIFRCSPYGMRIFDADAPQNTYWEFREPNMTLFELKRGLHSREFCIPKSDFVNGEKKLGVEFTNAAGEVICTLGDTVKANLCCDSVTVINEPSVAGGECSGKIFFGIPEDAPCDIAGIRTSHLSNPQTRNGYSVGYSHDYCLTEGRTETFTGYFVNRMGDTVCDKSITISCPGVSCCGALQVELKHHPNPLVAHPCCYQYHLNINPCYRCPNVFTVREKGGDTILQGYDILRAIPPLGAPALVKGSVCNKHSQTPITTLLELLDMDGNIICTVPIEIPSCNYIPIGLSKKKSILNDNNDSPAPVINNVQIQPNPADETIKISFDVAETVDCAIRITDMLGRIVKEEKVFLNDGTNIRNYNTSEWAEGIYFLQISLPGSLQTKKFSVEH